MFPCLDFHYRPPCKKDFNKTLKPGIFINILCIMKINQIPVINGANANLYGGTFPLSR